MAANNRRLKKILTAWSETDGYTISPEMNRALEEAWLANPSFDIDEEMTKSIEASRAMREEYSDG
jgi:hypothetical protein